MILRDYRIVYQYKGRLYIRIMHNCADIKVAAMLFEGEINHDVIISISEVGK